MPSFFNAQEIHELADALAAICATGELLGRARIRRRQEQTETFGESGPPETFADDVTDFACFDEAPLKPMPPRKALAHFRSLVPKLGVDPATWVDDMGRQAFTMAHAADQRMLERVQGLIDGRIATGRGISTAPREIDSLMDEAGVTPKNPQYSQMVVRTNMMGSYNRGAMAEMRAPGVADTFPAWRYLGIKDGRQRETHRVHFDQLYHNAIDFEEVRDAEKSEFDGYNCRCTPQPIDKWELKKLRDGGAVVHQSAEEYVEKFAELDTSPPAGSDASTPRLLNLPDVRQTDHYSCGAAAAMATGRYFGVGPDTLPEWKKALGTDVEESTRPHSIVEYLRSLGLTVEARAGMTLADLAGYWRRGWAVICPVQDYGPEVPKKADFAYGHYLTVIGVWSGYVFCQDSSQDNVVKGQGDDAAPGRVMIEAGRFLDAWHDEDVDGKPYVRFGIAVGPGPEKFGGPGSGRRPGANVTSALKAAHPFPGERPPDVPGTGNPEMLTKDPALRAAKEAQDEHAAAYHRAYTADLTHRLLSDAEPKPPATAKQAVERVGEASGDLSALGTAYQSHQNAVAASHPEGGAAIAAAKTEAERRYHQAVETAEQKVAALPDGIRDKAHRILDANKHVTLSEALT